MEHLNFIKNKILTSQELLTKRAYWNFKNQSVVFTNGCFDIIHRGHVEYLAKAASLGQVMVIGVNTDLSVRKIKGDNRPVQDQDTRALVLAAMEFVSAVILFDEDTPYELIKAVQPDILVKGADYKPEEIVGYDIVTARGGKVVTIPFVEGFSTTSIIQKLSK
ncbi:MAG TPA: D-glycero-beta-D-manno-heptose 1-phosphate adenylyltransferase [Williamwhitmania sp.]|nr:D-glycero-beta-D-manno-heptose 1-phosphate adenylyltransferase [Williamwhitmania sp.]